MRRGRWFTAVVAAAFLSIAAGEGLAQRGGGSRGGSRGGSSFGGGSRGGMSSGSSSSGRSYGGSSSSKPSAAPSSPGTSPGRSYGGSSSSSPSTSTVPGASSGRSYGSSGSTSNVVKNIARGSLVRPSLGTDSTAAQQRTESRISFQKANAPRDSYRTASGKTVPIDRNNPTQAAENDRLRGQLNASRMETRVAREDAAYSRWRSQPPYYYNDPFHMNFSSLFLTWALIDQARYLSRHESMMDQDRVNRLYAENAQLREQVAQVKKDGVPSDWKPPLDGEDLAYSTDYTATVAGYDTVRPSAAGTTLAANRPAGSGSALDGLLKFAFWSVVVAAAGYLLYFSIFKYKF